MTRISTLAAMAGAGLLAATAAPAQAETLSFSTNTATQPDNTLSFDLFDPTLGTLTGVSFSLGNSAASVSATMSVSGGEGGAGAGTAVVNFLATGPGAGGPDAIPLFQGNTSTTANCTSNGGGCSNTTSAGASINTSATVNGAADLPSYEGIGTFDVDVSGGPVNASTNACIGFNGGTPICTTTGSATWTGDITVSFQFTPAETGVPEPGTFGLLAAALSGMAMLTRRRGITQR